MLKDSHGLWAYSAIAPPHTESLAHDTTATVVVIGGGFTGMSTALHLAERQSDVVVLEAMEIGFGASGRNAGLVNAGLWIEPGVLEQTLGPVFGPRLLTLLGDAPNVVFEIIDRHAISCEARRAGTIHCAVGKRGVAEMVARARQWRAIGAPVRVLDKEETRAKTGTSLYEAGLLDLRAGTIQPLSYVRGLARAAIEFGARVFTQSPAQSIARESGTWRVRTSSGSIRAKWVVLATDVYTHTIAPGLRTEQAVLPYFNIATAPLAETLRREILPDGQGAWDNRKVLTHFRLDQAGSLIVGSVGALRGTGFLVHRAWARQHIRTLFPQLRGIRIEHEWYGMIGMTDDHLPRLHVPADNMIAVAGYNGRGIAPGTVFGRELARHIEGELSLAEMPLPVTAPEKARFRAAHEALYEFGSQLAHLPLPR